MWWLPGTHQVALTSPPQHDRGRKKDEKFVGQDKGTLMKEAKAAHGSKAKKRFIPYFPSAGDVQSLPGEQNLSMHSSCFRRQIP